MSTWEVRGLVLVRMASTLLVLGALPAQGDRAIPEIRSVPELASWLERQQREIPFVSGRARSTRTKFDGSVAVRSGTIELSFVFETNPHGRGLIDFSSRPMEDQDGRLFEMVYLTGYDGQTSWRHRRATTMTAPGGEPVALQPDGQLRRGRDVNQAWDPDTGFSSTLLGFHSQRQAGFAEVLGRGEVEFAIHAGEDDDHIQLVGRSSRGVEDRWTLRRSWAYGLCRHVQSGSEGQIRRERHILEAVRVHERFWYPTKVLATSFQGGVLTHEWNLEIEDVRCPDVVADEVFKPRFQPGTPVSDLDTGKVTIVAMPGTATTPRRVPVGDSQAPLVLFDPEPTPPSFALRTLSLLALLVAALLAFLTWRPRRPTGRPRSARGRRSAGGDARRRQADSVD